MSYNVMRRSGYLTNETSRCAVIKGAYRWGLAVVKVTSPTSKLAVDGRRVILRPSESLQPSASWWPICSDIRLAAGWEKPLEQVVVACNKIRLIGI